jgi:Fur family ferric uptake transcriptional regulator
MTANRTRRGPHETRQRQAVPHALAQAPGYLSAQAPHTHLRQAGETIASTTVYRALHILADAGRIGSTHDAGLLVAALRRVSGVLPPRW